MVINESSSLLDNAYTNIAQCGKIWSSGIITTDFSNHYSIFSIANFTLYKVKPVFIRNREFSDSNKTRFRNALKLQTWDSVYNADCANSAYKCFQYIFVNLFEMHFPLVNIRINYFNKLPWLTNGLRKSVKHKSNLRRMMKKGPYPPNITNHKKHENLLTSLMRKGAKNTSKNNLSLVTQ